MCTRVYKAMYTQLLDIKTRPWSPQAPSFLTTVCLHRNNANLALWHNHVINFGKQENFDPPGSSNKTSSRPGLSSKLCMSQLDMTTVLDMPNALTVYFTYYNGHDSYEMSN